MLIRCDTLSIPELLTATDTLVYHELLVVPDTFDVFEILVYIDNRNNIISTSVLLYTAFHSNDEVYAQVSQLHKAQKLEVPLTFSILYEDFLRTA